jgi:esterase/lipase superfamily enzyme
MKREYHRWPSAALGRDMELLAFGHAGARVLAFPTSQGHFHEWEDHGLVHALADPLDRGWLQLFCLDSVDAESWYARERPPTDRALRHNQYDEYLLEEVLPFTRERNNNAFVIVAGAAFGAYHAVNFGLRHPEHVNRILGLSGLYDIRRFTDGHFDQNVYFNHPVEVMTYEQEPTRLDALRQLDIILAVGRDDPHRGSNEALSGLLWSKDIWHALRIWDGFAHDWPVWERMLQLYINGHD